LTRPDQHYVSRSTPTFTAPPPLGSAQASSPRAPPGPISLPSMQVPGARWVVSCSKVLRGNRWGPLSFSLNSSAFASPARRECEPSVPCRSRCGSADGLALEPASQLCNRAHSRIALQVQPTRWARPPHAPASAPTAAVLRSRGKIQFVIGTHADKTLGSCESGLTQPELVSNDDLTG
jgi:hypothetical protein